MQEHVTLLSPADHLERKEPLGLFPELMEQVRGLVRPVALLLFVSISFYSLTCLGTELAGSGVPVSDG